MARPDKVAAVADVREGLTSSAATLLTNYRGLSVSELQELRSELRKANASYRVAKNTLTRIAARDAGFDGLDDLLVGPTALVFCEDDPVGPAKTLKAFSRDHPALEFKGGYLEGGVLDADEALRLADLESREDLLSRLAGLMHGALANTARLLNALPEKQARLLQALVDAGGAPGAPADEPEAAPAQEPATEADAADEAPESTSETTAPEEAANEVAEDEAPATEAAPAEEPVAEAVEESPDDAESDDAESADAESDEDEA